MNGVFLTSGSKRAGAGSDLDVPKVGEFGRSTGYHGHFRRRGRRLGVRRDNRQTVETQNAQAHDVPLYRVRAGTRGDKDMSCSVTIRKLYNVTIVELGGKFTTADASGVIWGAVSDLLVAGHRHILLELSKVSHLD